MTRLALLGLFLLSGCAGDYVARTRGVREAYEREDYPQALNTLDAATKEESEKDRLLVLLDKGMILHAAGRWQESIAVLAEAERVASELIAVSVSEETGVLLSNERRRAYRGEDFERLMITVLQALNYAQLGKDEDALVEVRRVNERLLKMVQEEKKPYEQLAIARYLGGALYEDQKDWDSAFIDYDQAFKLSPQMGPVLAEPLLRLSRQTGRDDALAALAKRFPGPLPEPLGPDEGQVLVVVEAGRSPEKESSSTRNDNLGVIQIPVYRDRGSAPRVEVELAGQRQVAEELTSLSQVAQIHLQDRVGRMILKQVAGAAVKAGLAAGAGALTHSKEVGVLAFFLLNLSNAPDLRSWLSLPAEFQLARFRVPAGTHLLRLKGVRGAVERSIEVKPRRISIVVNRQP